MDLVIETRLTGIDDYYIMFLLGVFNVDYLKNGLASWADDILAIRLPRWSDLPDFDLYMEQVVTIINDNLSFLHPEVKGSILTPAMVNNYVKQRVIPKPYKKRYNRGHLAFLMIIVILKPVLPIGDIRDGTRMQLEAFKGNMQGAYDLFIKQLEKNLHSIAHLAKDESEETHLVHHLPVGMRGIYMITCSRASRLYAEKVLEIERVYQNAESRAFQETNYNEEN